MVSPPFSGAFGVDGSNMALSGHWTVDSGRGVNKCGAAVLHKIVPTRVGDFA
jgi:hypothetical protein